MKITVTKPDGQYIIEGETAKEINEVIKLMEYGRQPDILELNKAKEPDNSKNWPKKIRPENAAKFIKDNSLTGIIAAFGNKESSRGQISVLTKNYSGTGRYVFNSLTDAVFRGNSFMPDGQQLDQVINYMRGDSEVYAFKSAKEFIKYCNQYLK